MKCANRLNNRRIRTDCRFALPPDLGEYATAAASLGRCAPLPPAPVRQLFVTPRISKSFCFSPIRPIPQTERAGVKPRVNTHGGPVATCRRHRQALPPGNIALLPSATSATSRTRLDAVDVQSSIHHRGLRASLGGHDVRHPVCVPRLVTRNMLPDTAASSAMQPAPSDRMPALGDVIHLLRVHVRLWLVPAVADRRGRRRLRRGPRGDVGGLAGPDRSQRGVERREVAGQVQLSRRNEDHPGDDPGSGQEPQRVGGRVARSRSAGRATEIPAAWPTERDIVDGAQVRQARSAQGGRVRQDRSLLSRPSGPKTATDRWR